MNLRAVIVDDEPLARVRMRSLLADEVGVEIVGECADGPTAAETLRRERPDVVFLDIRMPGMNGFEVLESLEPECLPWTVFVTAFDEHAVEAFEAGALDYVLKPPSRVRVRAAIARVRARLGEGMSTTRLHDWLAEREAANRLVIREGGRVIFLPVAKIDWIESAGNYALVHAGTGTHILRQTLNELEQQLPAERFFRISRGAIVNLRQVGELLTDGAQTNLRLNGGPTIPMTRSRSEIQKRIEKMK